MAGVYGWARCGPVPSPLVSTPSDPYRVEVVHWDGVGKGAAHLADALNRFAGDGWEVVAVAPVRAGASARALIGANASADTTELAVVLRRT